MNQNRSWERCENIMNFILRTEAWYKKDVGCYTWTKQGSEGKNGFLRVL